MSNQVSFKVDEADAEMIVAVVNRAEAMSRLFGTGLRFDRMSMHMDLTAAHANGNPMDFAKLLAAPDGDFGHDVFGIRRYIDRDTGTLTNCFVPRCSKRETKGIRP